MGRQPPPGRMPDAIAVRREGIDDLLHQFPHRQVLLDKGYLGLRQDHPDQAVTPLQKADTICPPEVHEARERARHQHSPQRFPVGHVLADN
ncbi:hypothetical protein GCM10010440_67000 [Kitasatospora cinereorecta]